MSSGMSKLFGTVGKSKEFCPGLGESTRNREDADSIMEKHFKANTKSGPGGCLTWTGYVHRGMTPQTSVRGVKMYPRRWVWEWEVGQLDDGEYVHPRCGNRLCMNTEHLVVTRSARIPKIVPPGEDERHLDEKYELFAELQPNGCMAWAGGFQRGVPYFTHKKKHLSVRRWLWERTHGSAGKQYVNSKCGNKDCVRKEHLELCGSARAVHPDSIDRMEEIVREKYDRYAKRDPGSMCVLWTGLMKDGTQPTVSVCNKHVTVRRWALERARGKITGHKYVIPTCGNQRCVSYMHAAVRDNPRGV